MAGSRSSSSETLAASPRLPQLAKYGPGPHRLHWIGAIQRSTDPGSITGYDIAAQFVDVNGDGSSSFDIMLPLTALPHLAAGSIWRNQMFSGLAAAKMGTVTIDMAQFDPKRHAAQNPYSLIPASVYALAEVPNRCWCRTLPLVDGSEIIVPTWEILRTAYFFHPRLIPPFLGGALDHPDTVSPKILPWRPEETFRRSIDEVQIGYPQFVSRKLALRLARLIFDSEASDGIRHIFRSIRRDASTGGEVIKVPPVRPPFRAEGKWTIRYIDVPPFHGAPRRRLVLSIHGINHALPYRRVIAVAANDARSTPDKNDSLPQINRPQSKLILPDHGGLDLYGSAGDSKLQTVDVGGLELEDNATEVVTVLPFKEHQTHQSGGQGKEPDVEVSGVALDSTGLPVSGRPELAAGDESLPANEKQSPEESEEVEPIDMGRVFFELRDVLLERPELMGWTVEPFGSESGLLRVHNEITMQVRNFLVLHIHHTHRNLYLIDAAKLKGYEKYRVLICETPDGSPISSGMFTDWLGNFPYPHGRHWLDHGEDGLLLRPDYLIHQPRSPGIEAKIIRKRFVTRLTRFVLEFADSL